MSEITRRVYTESAVARMRQMKRDGATAFEVAMALGTTEASVRSRSAQLRIKRVNAGFLAASVGGDVVEIFTNEARRRGMRLSHLVRDVLRRIARENLFGAVIDDGK